MTPASLGKGQLVELDIESAGFEGVAVGRVDQFVVFVRNAVPGDRVRALIRRKRKRFAEATLEELLEPSPHRVEPRCPHFGACGGCRWQNTDYETQLSFKRKQVEDLFRRVGGLPPIEIRPVLPSPKQFEYRNKMEFTFGTSRWLTRREIASGQDLDRSFALGLHIPRRFDKILDLDVCYLQSSPSPEVVNQVRQLALEQKWTAYDAREHVGFLRNLVIRTGENTGQLMVNLVTSRHEPSRMALVKQNLLEGFPQITTLINCVNTTRSPAAAGEEIVYHGPGTITERLGSLCFTIAATTFFQPNTLQAERLYQVVAEFADLKGDELVYDLYSGIGGIALSLAGQAGKVVGVESDPKAVEDSHRNAVENGITNCAFHCEDVQRVLRNDLARQAQRPDVLIVDPPRVGLGDPLTRLILKTRPSRLVYVSCNPATQARDLSQLISHYRIKLAQPVDMFPHTSHIENVVALELKE